MKLSVYWLILLAAFACLFGLVFFRSRALEAGKGVDEGCKGEERIENVVRIFMHDPSSYTLMIKDPVTGIMTLDRCFGQRVRFIPDVPTGKPMAVTTLKNAEPDGWCRRSLEFHVRSEADIGGGGWDHGKNGRGTTEVVQ